MKANAARKNMKITTPDDIHKAKFYYKFFADIPAQQWCQGHLTSPLDSTRHCAVGHLGNAGIDGGELANLFHRFGVGIFGINDYRNDLPMKDRDNIFCRGEKARNNILHALDTIINWNEN